MSRSGRPPLEPWKVSKAMELRASGSSWGKIAAELGIGRTTAREAVLGKRRGGLSAILGLVKDGPPSDAAHLDADPDACPYCHVHPHGHLAKDCTAREPVRKPVGPDGTSPTPHTAENVEPGGPPT